MFIKGQKSLSEEQSDSDTDSDVGTDITFEATTNGSTKLDDNGTDNENSKTTDNEQHVSNNSSSLQFSGDRGSESGLSEMQMCLVYDERCQQCSCVRTVMQILNLEFDEEIVEPENLKYKQGRPLYPVCPELREGDTFSLAER